ncbi:MAG: S46 family peptidase [SAR86 cluster bacterium]|jgi:hypothetical protein|uniref:Dipeptidyl-peptidase n=1 Tax=SAR86 cluster bacterium TaxID=2030880 RepID=A0A520MD09_9GAMM|nr:MAG: S46 family peptidase [SAR86 cluster bacterium]
MIRLTLFIVLLLPSIQLNADEGMWEPHQLPNIEKDIRAAGFRGNIRKFSNLFEHPLNAIVSLGGCSAAFISDSGLIATNYHCVEGSYLQFNTRRMEKDLFKTGFIARSIEEEAPSAPGARVYITQESTDVTSKVLKGTSKSSSENERYQMIQNNRKNLIKSCETSQEYQCEVRSFYSGETYQLIKKMIIKDVRLVYAPPQSIGEFGGEIDNWMYPRHTGDFALLRAYVSPQNESKEYSEDNVPYKSKSFLKISKRGVQENDFVMVAGYPGRTNRLITYPEIRFDVQFGFDSYVEYLKSGIDLMRDLTKDDQAKALKYRGSISGYENYYKKISGQIEGAKNFNLLKQERQNWNKFLEFIETEGTDAEQNALDKLLEITNEINSESLNNMYYGGSTLLSTASTIYRYAYEKTKPNNEREPGYQERDHERIVNRLRGLDYRFDADVDKGIFLYRLNRYRDVESKVRRQAFSKALKLDSAYEETLAKVNNMYSYQSDILDTQKRIALLDLTLEDLNNSSDPFFTLVREMFDENMAREKKNKARSSLQQKNKSIFIKSLRKFYKSQGKDIYADANGTLRVTFGNVMGVELKDGVYYKPFTTLEGIAQKNTGVSPFEVDTKQLKLISDKEYGSYSFSDIGSVPVNYISNLDITNGNSGSSTINTRGEFVGLAFDGMLETIISDYKFIPQTRTIHVDSRYLLWALEVYEKDTRLIDEMMIVR